MAACSPSRPTNTAPDGTRPPDAGLGVPTDDGSLVRSYGRPVAVNGDQTSGAEPDNLPAEDLLTKLAATVGDLLGGEAGEEPDDEPSEEEQCADAPPSP